VENVPILVCLTFADQLYAELDGKESVRYELEVEQSVRFSVLQYALPWDTFGEGS